MNSSLLSGILNGCNGSGPGIDWIGHQYRTRGSRKTPEKRSSSSRGNIVRYWRTRPAKSITRRDGVLLLDKVVDRNAPVMANRVGALLSAPSSRRCFALRSPAECSKPARSLPWVGQVDRKRRATVDSMIRRSASSGRSSRGHGLAPRCELR
jgi:hypothetical protein